MPGDKGRYDRLFSTRRTISRSITSPGGHCGAVRQVEQCIEALQSGDPILIRTRCLEYRWVDFRFARVRWHAGESGGLPMAVRHAGPAAFAARRSSAQARHLCGERVTSLMKTCFAGSRSGWRSNPARRRLRISGRPCSQWALERVSNATSRRSEAFCSEKATRPDRVNFL